MRRGRASKTEPLTGEILGPQRFGIHSFPFGDLESSLIDLCQRSGVRQQVECVFERFEVLGADEDSCGAAISGQDHAVMLVFHPVHDLGEMGLDVGER